jgi:hypothetical protein
MPPEQAADQRPFTASLTRRRFDRARSVAGPPALMAGRTRLPAVHLLRRMPASGRAGKIGAFIGTYALTAMLPAVGLSKTCSLVAGVSVLGLLATLFLLPEPKGSSLEEFTEEKRCPTSAVALALAESRGTRPPSA